MCPENNIVAQAATPTTWARPPSIEQITHNAETIAIIIHADYHSDGIAFFTPDSFSQQLAYMNRPTGYTIPAHVHNPVHRDVFYTLWKCCSSNAARCGWIFTRRNVHTWRNTPLFTGGETMNTDTIEFPEAKAQKLRD